MTSLNSASELHSGIMTALQMQTRPNLGPKILNEILFLFNYTKEHVTATNLAIFTALITALACLNFNFKIGSINVP